MHHVIQIIHQERRRLLFVVVLSYVAGLIAHLHLDIFVSGWPIAIFFASLQATVVGVFALLVCLLTPSLRFMVEAFAVSRLVFALFVYFFPGIGYPILTEPMLAAVIVILGGSLASRLIHGRFCKPQIEGLQDRLRAVSRRRPARLVSQPWQFNFVHWVDDTRPVDAGPKPVYSVSSTV